MLVSAPYNEKEMPYSSIVRTFLNPVKHRSHVWPEQGREGARVQELVRNKETRGDWDRGTRSLCAVPIPGSC